MALVFSSILLTERRYQHPTSDFMLFWATPGLNSQVVPVTRQEFCPLNSIVTLFTLFQMRTGVGIPMTSQLKYTWAPVTFQMSLGVSQWKDLARRCPC